jgi:predicted metal-dependent hydrolase
MVFNIILTLMALFEYKVIYSSRRSVSINISPDKGVVVRAPYGMSRARIDNFVIAKSDWVSSHLSKHEGYIMLNHGKSYSEGEKHYYMGKQYTLRILPSKRVSVVLSGEAIEIGVPDSADKKRLKAVLNRWYSSQAKEYLATRVKSIISETVSHGFRPEKIIVRSTKSRWGSCSSKGTISLSSELIKLDEKFHDYIILHELCHLKHHNHGAGFYKLLAELKPDYKELRKELRKYITK